MSINNLIATWNIICPRPDLVLALLRIMLVFLRPLPLFKINF